MAITGVNYNSALYSIDSERSRRSCHHFIFGDHCGSRLLTKDEHDHLNPLKPFPDAIYLKNLVDCLLVAAKFIKPEQAIFAKECGHSIKWLQNIYDSGILCLEKSRQIMATWMTCAFILWRAKYHGHQLILVQSKREDDAANLVFNKEPFNARISCMEYHLPEHLKTMEFPGSGSYGHLYLKNGSHVWAIPEGGDIVRSNTPSMIFCDEAAFQPQFGASYTAALPAVKGGGMYVAISSAENGEFAALVEGNQ